MTALYNEIDPYAADWLENLVRAGQIAPGIVDRRSIEDLEPDYVRCFTQVHLFAGLGLWSLGLRRAGWADDRPIWTGSCPCQPFSAAGESGGFADERHLWPAYFHLVQQCRPPVVAGEQVASALGLSWLDLVSGDLEAAGYAVGAVDTCAAGFGAPHIRQRLWWVGVAPGVGRSWVRHQSEHVQSGQGSSGSSSVAYPHDALRGPDVPAGDHAAGPHAGRAQGASDLGAGGGRCGLADANGGDAGAERQQSGGEQRQQPQDGGAMRWVADARRLGLRSGQPGGLEGATGTDESAVEQQQRLWLDPEHGGARSRDATRGGPGPVNGLWRDADWLFCRDEKWRPVEPGSFPLVDALPRGMGTVGPGLLGLVRLAGVDRRSLARAKAFRTGTLRGFGNGLNLEQVTAFCEALV